MFELTSTSVVLRIIAVTAIGGPMTVSADHFTLVDADGTGYPLVVEALTGMESVFGVARLPETSVDPGTTVSGTVLFAVSPTSSEPWVVQVAPETIGATGEAPDILVIEGPLPPIDLGA